MPTSAGRRDSVCRSTLLVLAPPKLRKRFDPNRYIVDLKLAQLLFVIAALSFFMRGKEEMK